MEERWQIRVEKTEPAAKINGVVYESVMAAVAAANDGDTIVMTADSTESFVMLQKGVTLDLNGFTLTADNFVTLYGTQVKNTKNTGILRVPQTGISLQVTNTYVPVWNEVDGYYLVEWGYGTKVEYPAEGTTRYWFLPKPRNNGSGTENSAVVDLLKNGAADNQLEIIVHLKWSNSLGEMEQTFRYNQETIMAVYNNNSALSNSETMFYLDVTGYEAFDSVTMQAAVVSALKCEDAANVKVIK